MFQCLRMYLGPLWHDFRHSSSRVTQAQREEGDSLAEASDVVPVLALVSGLALTWFLTQQQLQSGLLRQA